MKKYHFISGLPRSGSTLLSTILRQNPRFEASISGPLGRFTRSIIQESTSQGGYRVECPPEKRKKLIAGLFDNYYDDPSKEVAFNTNRGWGVMLHTLKDLFPESKVIMCVRELGWILDSFESLLRKNPYTNPAVFSPQENVSVYSRCETLMHPTRPVGYAYNAVKQALAGEHRKSILIVEYDDLARAPEGIMRSIYSFINEPYFPHDFDNCEASYDEFDEELQIPGLHRTRKKVEFLKRETILPPDIWHKLKGAEVWRAANNPNIQVNF